MYKHVFDFLHAVEEIRFLPLSQYNIYFPLKILQLSNVLIYLYFSMSKLWIAL